MFLDNHYLISSGLSNIFFQKCFILKFVKGKNPTLKISYSLLNVFYFRSQKKKNPFTEFKYRVTICSDMNRSWKFEMLFKSMNFQGSMHLLVSISDRLSFLWTKFRAKVCSQINIQVSDICYHRQNLGKEEYALQSMGNIHICVNITIYITQRSILRYTCI